MRFLALVSFFLATLTVAALGGAVVAEARDRTGQFSVGGNLGLATEAPWAHSPFSRAVGPGPKLSFLGRYHHDNPSSGFELSLDYFKMSQRNFASRSASISYFWRFLFDRPIHPIFSIGVGYSRVNAFFSGGDAAMPFFRTRVGVEWEYNEKLDFTFHLDHFSIFRDLPVDPNAHVLAPSVGVIYYFGEPPIAVAATTPPIATMDADGDGVLDTLDRCAQTPKGTPVNSLGCAEAQSFAVSLDVKFASRTANLTAGSDKAIAELAKLLKAHKELKVEIQGFTDDSGTPAQNQPLSQHRANVVREELVQGHGISPGRVTARGYGEAHPIASNKTEAGRAQNRRVTAKIVLR